MTMLSPQSTPSLDLLIGIGDLHGHFPALESLLYRLHIQYDLFRNTAPLRLRPGIEMVFTGDYIDRGEQNLKVIGTLMELREENPAQVHELFGNHELLALAGLQRAEQCLSYRDVFYNYQVETLHGANGGVQFIKEFGATPEEALRSYVQRLSRDGDIGRWMRSLKPMHRTEIGGRKVLFVHGGIPEKIADGSNLDAYMTSVRVHLEQRTENFRSASQKFFHDSKVGSHSIFWDRRIPRMYEHELEEMTKKLGVDYIVIGHTPQERLMNFWNRAFDIDVGMSPVYGERDPQAIVFKPEGVFAFNARQRKEEALVTPHTHNHDDQLSKKVSIPQTIEPITRMMGELAEQISVPQGITTASPRITKEPDQNEVALFLKQFGIPVEDRSPHLWSEMTVAWHGDLPNRIFTEAYMYNTDISLHHQVLARTLQLLPPSLFSRKPFHELVLWGKSGFEYGVKNYSFFDPNSRVLSINYPAKGLPFLGLAHVLLYEIGHSLEETYPHLPPIELPYSYYARRNASLPLGVHDASHRDALMFLAMNTKEQVQENVEPQDWAALQEFRREVFGESYDQRPHLQSLLDAVLQNEERRGFVERKIWGTKFTGNYKRILREFQHEIR